MKFALAQISSVTGDLKGNLNKILEQIKEAKNNNTDLIIFPEMALTGYCISDLIEDDLFVIKNKEMLDEIKKETNNIAVIIGFVDFDKSKKNNDGRIRKYNAVALIQNNQIIGIVHKTLLANYRYFDDKRYFVPGDNQTPLTIIVNNKKMKLGISICEDMWDDDYSIKPIKDLVSNGANIIININASPFYPQKIKERENQIKKHIKEFNLPFIYVNTVGSADNGKNIIPFDGRSMVYDKDANLIALGKSFEEEIVYVDFENKKIITTPILNREKEIYDALVMSIRDYANQTGFKKAIVPVSGGVDSALGLVLTVEALGHENVISYNLPSKFNTTMTKNLAEKLSKNLNVEYKIIPIQEIDDKIKYIFTNNVRQIKKNVTKENIHARIRGLFMMLESNDTDALLISNGNKTEIALGYSTLYGDMCGGISVIGDLSKTDVYKICKYINKKFNSQIIPQEIFDIKPSAELSEGQYDPFDYEVVSLLVDLFIEERHSSNEIIKQFKEKNLGKQFNFKKDTIYDRHTIESFIKLVNELYSLIKRSVYKRLQGPPIIAVTKRAFGFDLRETLINKWNGGTL